MHRYEDNPATVDLIDIEVNEVSEVKMPSAELDYPEQQLQN